MKVFFRIIWILTILLSVSTGLFKLMQQKADIKLFEALGMDATATTILGAIQLIGGLLLIPVKSRKLGAYILIPTFILASAAVFANNMIPFGIVSLLFIVMALSVIYMENKYPSSDLKP